MDIISMPTNQSWKLRSKHGRDRLFRTPEELWNAASLYFEWCDQNPVYIDVVRGREVVTVSKMRAYTFQGLCLHLGCGVNYFTQFETKLADKNDEQSEDFKDVIQMIRAAIFDQKYIGAAAGALNANLISRDLGLMGKSGVGSSAAYEPPKPRTIIIWGDQKIPI